jgi:hypothetical protein
MTITELREQTSNAIFNAGIDTTTQLNAIARIYSPVRSDAIITYVSLCVQEYRRCKDLILQENPNVEFIIPPVWQEMYEDSFL